jgi:hypothetical protein
MPSSSVSEESNGELIYINKLNLLKKNPRCVWWCLPVRRSSQENCELEASLVYSTSSRPARTTKWYLVSKAMIIIINPCYCFWKPCLYDTAYILVSLTETSNIARLNVWVLWPKLLASQPTTEVRVPPTPSSHTQHTLSYWQWLSHCPDTAIYFQKLCASECVQKHVACACGRGASICLANLGILKMLLSLEQIRGRAGLWF